MVHLKLVAGTAVGGVRRSEYEIDDRASMDNRSEAEREAAARRILRNLKLPGGTKTIAELLDEVNRNACDEKASDVERTIRHHNITRRLHEYGIKVSTSSRYGWRLRTARFSAVTDFAIEKLLDAFPELERYRDVLCYFEI
jgi:hypothetical protein